MTGVVNGYITREKLDDEAETATRKYYWVSASSTSSTPSLSTATAYFTGEGTEITVSQEKISSGSTSSCKIWYDDTHLLLVTGNSSDTARIIFTADTNDKIVSVCTTTYYDDAFHSNDGMGYYGELPKKLPSRYEKRLYEYNVSDSLVTKVTRIDSLQTERCVMNITWE